MAIIPRYTSRALPPGAQPGLIESAQARGRAGAGLARALGGAVVAGVKYKARKDAAEAHRTQTLKDINASLEEGRDRIEDFGKIGEYPPATLPDGGTVEFGGSTPASNTVAGKAAGSKSNLFKRTDQRKQVSATLDDQSEKVSLGSFETAILGFGVEAKAALNQGGTPAKGATQRALAAFDLKVSKLSKGIENQPHLKNDFDALVASVRAPLEFRLLGHENARRAEEDKAKLSDSLNGLAQAAVVDPAMAPGITGRGFAQIEGAMEAGMLSGQEAAGMQRDFADRVHMAAMRGQIAADPANMQTRLAAGEFDDIFEAEARDRLIGEARTTARVKSAGASAAARAKRRGLEIDMAAYLEDLAETGAGDEAVAARAQADLPEFEQAAFQAAEAQARERHATRAEYAFMTEEGIEADIAAQAPGGPRNIDRRDGNERDAAHALRTEIRDEVLAARAADPAGWAMRDAEVAASFAAAWENPDDPAAMRRAHAMRLALQREIGIEQPRLLSDAERDEIAGELAQATPADRPAIIAGLRGRYGARYDAAVKELFGRVAPGTGVLMAHAGDPLLASALARGLAMDSVEFKGARVLSLPMVDGKLVSSRLVDKQLYTFMAGDRVFGVVYDRKADALVPTLVEAKSEGDGTSQMGRTRSAIHGAAQDFVGVFAGLPEGLAISEGAVYQGVLNVFNQIEANEKPDMSGIVGWAKGTELFRKYLQGDRAERDALYAEVEGIARGVIGSDLYGAGQWIRETARQAFPTNPEYEDEFQQRLARGGGALAGFVVTGAAGRVIRIPAVVTTATMGAYSNASVLFQNAIANGADWEEAYRAAQLGFGAGMTEGLPIARLFGRIDKGAGGSIRHALIEAAKGGTEEVLQEGFEAIAKELILSGVVTYDPDRQVFDAVGENADVSFTLGALANFVAAATGIRRRQTGPMDAPRHSVAPQGEGFGVELAPEDVGNAPSGDALSGNAVAEDVESGAETGAGSDFDVSIAERVIVDDLIADYDKTSRHESFRNTEKQYAESGQAGRNAFGLIDPASGKPIIQPINDAEQMLAMAEENVQPLTQQLKEIVADLPGVEFGSARAKKPDRMGQKLAGERRPDTLGDYLGGRIVVNDPSMLTEAVRVLAGRYKNIEIDYFIKKPREESGYRAVHMQVVLDNGMTAEIHIMPSDIFEVYNREHKKYVKWRNKENLSPTEARQREDDKARAQAAYEKAYKRWLLRF